MEEAKQLLAERKQLFDDAINFKKTDKIPTISNVWGWKIIDSDIKTTIEQANDDWDLMEKVVREFIERYNFDAYMDLGAVNANAVAKALGHSRYQIHGNVVLSHDEPVIEDDGFADYFKDPAMYTWKKHGPKYFDGMTFGNLVKGIEEIYKYFNYVETINTVLSNEYGALRPPDDFIASPLEDFINELRGIKNFSIDLRRRPEVYAEYTESKAPYIDSIIEKVISEKSNDSCFADLYLAHNAHSVVNHKTFERFFWEPVIKKVVDAFSKTGKKAFVFWEADCIRFADLYADIPKGTMLILPEMEDVRNVRKAFPNIAIAGGMPVTLLGKGKPQECIDYAKKLIEEMGDGYIFSQNKMMAFANDATRENMVATQEFIQNYRR